MIDTVDVCLIHKAETVKNTVSTHHVHYGTDCVFVCWAASGSAQVYRHSPASVNAIHLRVTEKSHPSAKCPQTGLGAS